MLCSHGITYSTAGINSLALGRFEQNFRYVIFQLISVTDGWGISCKIALRWMPLHLTDHKSTLVQVMAWCRQATSHYLSQSWPSSMSSYGVTRPQWVKAEHKSICTHNRHPRSLPHRRAISEVFCDILEKFDLVMMAPHFIWMQCTIPCIRKNRIGSLTRLIS